MSSIFTPRVSIEMLRTGYFKGLHTNPCVCTVIPYGPYQISISMDSSHTDGDLFRSDIRVFTGDNIKDDHTGKFLKEGEYMLYGTGSTLRDIMLAIDKEMESK